MWLQPILDISMNFDMDQMWKTFDSNYNIGTNKECRDAIFLVSSLAA